MRASQAIILSIAVTTADLPGAEIPVADSLLPLPLTNGAQLRLALEPLAETVLPSCAWLVDRKARHLISATIVGDDGYFLTKASEVPSLEACGLRVAGHPEPLTVREIRRDTSLDLALGQIAMEQTSGKPPIRAVAWTSSNPAAFGHWHCSPSLASSRKGPELRLGVQSAKPRPIPSLGAALGIQMSDRAPVDSSGDSPPELPAARSGVTILSVARESPAESAGIKKGDVLLAVNDTAVTEYRAVNEMIQKRQPGDIVSLRIQREGREIQRKVRLASRSRVIANWDGDDYANGGISIRTDGFPMVIQHDLPLSPPDMGGPLFDLDGRAVGINIARADRITTFALPAETFMETLDSWLKEDRHPPKAVPVKIRER
jgi:serine protease Do